MLIYTVLLFQTIYQRNSVKFWEKDNNKCIVTVWNVAAYYLHLKTSKVSNKNQKNFNRNRIERNNMAQFRREQFLVAQILFFSNQTGWIISLAWDVYVYTAMYVRVLVFLHSFVLGVRVCRWWKLYATTKPFSLPLLLINYHFTPAQLFSCKYSLWEYSSINSLK